MTPQQDSLSGVIICPAYQSGQRLRVNSFTTASITSWNARWRQPAIQERTGGAGALGGLEEHRAVPAPMRRGRGWQAFLGRKPYSRRAGAYHCRRIIPARRCVQRGMRFLRGLGAAWVLHPRGPGLCRMPHLQPERRLLRLPQQRNNGASTPARLNRRFVPQDPAGGRPRLHSLRVQDADDEPCEVAESEAGRYVQLAIGPSEPAQAAPPDERE